MNALVDVKKLPVDDGSRQAVPVCNSRQVAKDFGKRHDNVLRAIRELEREIDSISSRSPSTMFYETEELDSYGRPQRVYLMTRKGFRLLVMGFTGRKALEWKLKYDNAFELVVQALQERGTPEWAQSRGTGIAQRHVLTSAVARFTAYVLRQNPAGHADKYYLHFTNLANGFAGLTTKRGLATAEQLSRLGFIEGVIAKCIDAEMAKGTEYHAVYAACRERVKQISALAA